MVKILHLLPDTIIKYSFYILFLLTPIILTPLNYELFEYNKMMLTYGLTAIITGMWLIKMIINRRIILKRTPLDIPLILFLVSQLVSTYISIDRHVSIWGYYSRFNGGLLSTISYFLLYYAFVSNFPGRKVGKLLKITLASGLLVSVYGILEHLGIDKDIWVQDVQNRVFSTLGQPNWLAAYLAVLIPITIGLMLDKFSIFNFQFSINFKNFKIKNYIGLLGYWAIGLLFYATLLFTKSRSGFLGFWIGDIIFWLLILGKYKQQLIKVFLIFNFSLLTFSFLFGTPFDQINRFSFSALTHNPQITTDKQPLKPTGGSVIDVGITESGTIRRIVWQGAIDIFRHYPLFGTGVETFAFSYYKFRPVEHNMTSEWDFLYNKAHNEYLNFAATTGSFGLGSYLLIIILFILWNIYTIILKAGDAREGSQPEMYRSVGILERQDPQIKILIISLFTGWLSILITNFFGFSVVIIQLFFFLIPAIVFVLSMDSSNEKPSTTNYQPLTIFQSSFCIILSLSIVYILYFLSRLWYADIVFANGYHKVRSQEIFPGYQSLKKALEINEEEPFYYDEFSYPAAEMAVAFNDEKETTLSASLTKEAIIATNFAVNHAPQNVNFWKSRTRVFYVLSQIDEKYYSDSLYSLEQSKLLSPTDPKIRYNLGLLYDKMGKKKEAISELEETTKLKPDYRDAFYALAYLYEKDNKRDKAKDSLKYILTKIATDDAEAKKKLEEFK